MVGGWRGEERNRGDGAEMQNKTGDQRHTHDRDGKHIQTLAPHVRGDGETGREGSRIL